MPPRFAYWTIILEGKPTAFRAQHREDLLPTLKQLQARHPDVVMKWFARGKLWESPEEEDLVRRGGNRERRSPDWRPGGEHRDPRARFDVPRDEKRRRFAAKLRRDARDRSAEGTKQDEQPGRGRRPFRQPLDPADRAKPRGSPPGRPDDRSGEKPRFDRPPRRDRRPAGNARAPEDRKSGSRPGGFRPGPRGPARGRKPGGGPGRGGRGGRGGGGAGGGRT